mgnify:CR=1 FL=1|jgi:2-polyprenyl-3-methyl-5-hydroxy-6-metoxy-1,4-benzoquinol methylase
MLSFFRKKNVVYDKKNVVYDESFFLEQWFDSWGDLKYILKNLIESQFNNRKILDFGCGPGVMIDIMNESKIDYIGCDYSIEARQLYLKNYGKFQEKYLSQIPEDKNFDLFLSFDVFEHLSDKEIGEILEKIKGTPYLFLNISRAKGIPGHINLKTDRQWVKYFESKQYKYMQTETDMIRKLYIKLKPDKSELWHKNIFIFNSINK